VYCWSRKIIPLCLPSHTTEKLQPLDVGIFLPLAQACKSLLYDCLRMVEKASEKAMTETTIQHRWAKAGLYPFDPAMKIAAESSAKNDFTKCHFRFQT
jgi:hypothetical protein